MIREAMVMEYMPTTCAYRDTPLISLHQGDGDHGGRQGDGDGVYADYHQWSPSTISRDPPPLPETITLLTCTAVLGTE